MGIKEFIKENRAYFEDFITRSTYHSNCIEGNTLSYAETYAIIFNDNEFEVSAKPREIYEAINHKYAVSFVLDNLEQELTENFIKKIGIFINKNINEQSGYRKVPVRIRGAEHIPPSAKDVPQKMMYYVYNYNHTQYENIYQKIADNHIQFERIHPFEDGNGRTGRLLINYELLKNGYAPIIIPQERKSEYFSYIAGMNIEALGNFLQELEKGEIERIKSFVDMEKSVAAKLEWNKSIMELEKRAGITNELNRDIEKERD